MGGERERTPGYFSETVGRVAEEENSGVEKRGGEGGNRGRE